MKQKKSLEYSLSGLINFLLFSPPVFANDDIDPNQMAYNMLSSLGHFGAIVQVISIVSGLGLFLSGLFELKRYGEMRTFMSHQVTITRPLVLLLSGIMLLTLPLMIETAMLAFWGNENPLAYNPVDKFSSWSPFIPVIISFVRLIGVIAFIRGLFLISRTGGQSGQPGTMGKALMHIFGGILCINIMATFDIMKSILPI